MAAPYAIASAPAFAFTECTFCYGTDPECHCKNRNPNNSSRTESDSGLAAGAQTDLRPNDRV
jgi:hypothetical protein